MASSSQVVSNSHQPVVSSRSPPAESLASAGLVPNAVMMIRPNNPDQQQPSGEADAVTTSTASTAMDGPGPREYTALPLHEFEGSL